MDTGLYNPLDMGELARSIADALRRQPPSLLPPELPFEGSGLYAIYYHGDFPPYRGLAKANLARPCSVPIYVGKAVPEGTRKGYTPEEEPPRGPYLYRRLREHARSVEQAENLRIEDFRCQYLVTDPVWIPLGERLLIQEHRPIWNIAIDGFGNHDPGSGRRGQQKSPWDEVHPGRAWAAGLGACPETKEALLERAIALISQR